MNDFLRIQQAGVATQDKALEWARVPAPQGLQNMTLVDSGNPKTTAQETMKLAETARAYEAAKQRAEKLFCQYRRDETNPRLLVRYVRSLRACERLKSELKGVAA